MKKVIGLLLCCVLLAGTAGCDLASLASLAGVDLSGIDINGLVSSLTTGDSQQNQNRETARNMFSYGNSE